MIKLCEYTKLNQNRFKYLDIASVQIDNKHQFKHMLLRLGTLPYYVYISNKYLIQTWYMSISSNDYPQQLICAFLFFFYTSKII